MIIEMLSDTDSFFGDVAGQVKSLKLSLKKVKAETGEDYSIIVFASDFFNSARAYEHLINLTESGIQFFVNVPFICFLDQKDRNIFRLIE